MKINSVFHRQFTVPLKCGLGRGGSIVKADGGAETAPQAQSEKSPVAAAQEREAFEAEDTAQGFRLQPQTVTSETHLQETEDRKERTTAVDIYCVLPLRDVLTFILLLLFHNDYTRKALFPASQMT